MVFDVFNLVAGIFIVYALFAIFQSKTAKSKGYALLVIILSLAFLTYKFLTLKPETAVDAPIFQQFNPCFVVALTPVSVALFGFLGKKGKEPKAPTKIGLVMLVAAVGFFVMVGSSMGLQKPAEADNIKNAKLIIK